MKTENPGSYSITTILGMAKCDQLRAVYARISRRNRRDREADDRTDAVRPGSREAYRAGGRTSGGDQQPAGALPRRTAEHHAAGEKHVLLAEAEDQPGHTGG